jgi:RNA polymerase sporulation-specific sigma factor
MAVTAEQRYLDVDRLARLAHAGNELAFDQLARTLAGFVTREARRVYVRGTDRDDVRQEALLALYAAVRAWDPQQQPFVPFARFVIRRQLATMIKTALRRKQQPLNTALRFEALVADGGYELTLGDITPSLEPGPHERLEQREKLQRLTAAASRLSDLERHALGGRLSGVPYDALGRHKAIDNAIQRARRRLCEAAA